MQASIVFFVAFAFSVNFCVASTCKGCIAVDQWSWEKLLPKFKLAVVKFDVAFPYGDKHEIYSSLAEELANHKEIMFIQVGIKDYGDKENKELGERYGIKSKDDLPNVKLFISNHEEPIDFPSNRQKEWSLNALRDFVRDNTDMYIGLPGCLEEFDKLAIKFVNADDKDVHIKEAEKLSENLEEKDQSTAKTYLLFMKKIIDQGKQFVTQETTRLGKILKEGKVKDKKKEELSQRLNILHSFKVKDEL